MTDEEYPGSFVARDPTLLPHDVYSIASEKNRASSSADVLAPSPPADPRLPAEDAREVDASAREIDASVWRSLGPGANISRAEMRGISLRQIEAIWAEIVRRVEVEEWTAIRPRADASTGASSRSLVRVRLTKETVTHHEVVRYLIKPATAARRCSFVELFAHAPQPPRCFVSHAWGETVQDFVACLRAHSFDHRLDDETPYWVHAYAHNPWCSSSDDMEIVSRAAMDASESMLTLVDEFGTSLSHACISRDLCAWLALREEQAPWSIYTVVHGDQGNSAGDGSQDRLEVSDDCEPKAVGLTSLPSPRDIERCQPLETEDRRRRSREAAFPFAVIRQALNMRLEEAKSSELTSQIAAMRTQPASRTEPQIGTPKGLRNFIIPGLSPRPAPAPAPAQKEQGSSCPIVEAVKCSGLDSVEAANDRVRARFAAAALHLSLTSDDFKSVLSVLSKGNLTRLSFDLSLCDGVTTTKTRALALHLPPSLTSLSVRVSLPKPAAAMANALGLVMRKLDNALGDLCLRGSRIGCAGASALAKALKHNSTLGILDLSFCRIGAKGGVALGRSLRFNTGLTRLELWGNNIGDKGAIEFGKALTHCSALVNLELGFNRIGVKGASAIATAIVASPILETLSLRNNSVGDEGASAIGVALLSNTSLKSLDLWANSIGGDGGKVLANALTQNSTLTTLQLGYNSIGDSGVDELASSLARNTQLTSLHLFDNGIGNEGAYALVRALTSNRSLTSLHVGRNSIDEDAAAALRCAARGNLDLDHGSFKSPRPPDRQQSSVELRSHSHLSQSADASASASASVAADAVLCV